MSAQELRDAFEALRATEEYQELMRLNDIAMGTPQFKAWVESTGVVYKGVVYKGKGPSPAFAAYAETREYKEREEQREKMKMTPEYKLWDQALSQTKDEPEKWPF